MSPALHIHILKISGEPALTLSKLNFMTCKYGGTEFGLLLPIPYLTSFITHIMYTFWLQMTFGLKSVDIQEPKYCL